MAVYNSDEWIGKKYNMLTVIEPVHVKNKMGNMWYWKVVCDCGNKKTARPIEVLSGRMKSCGCYRKKKAPWNTRHNESHTRLHNIWCGMIQRCNPENKHSERYGKRGIRVCDEWKTYEKFSAWALENGYSEDMTIERLDVNGNYCPENCAWIPIGKQARNRRTTFWVEYNGEKMSLAEACERANLPYKQVFSRIKVEGWSLGKALSTPIGETIGKTKYRCTCVVCKKEFTVHSPRGKYCSHECYLVYRKQQRHECFSFSQEYNKTY